jgi:hypothetical protein
MVFVLDLRREFFFSTTAVFRKLGIVERNRTVAPSGNWPSPPLKCLLLAYMRLGMTLARHVERAFESPTRRHRARSPSWREERRSRSCNVLSTSR